MTARSHSRDRRHQKRRNAANRRTTPITLDRRPPRTMGTDEARDGRTPGNAPATPSTKEPHHGHPHP